MELVVVEGWVLWITEQNHWSRVFCGDYTVDAGANADAATFGGGKVVTNGSLHWLASLSWSHVTFTFEAEQKYENTTYYSNLINCMLIRTLPRLL